MIPNSRFLDSTVVLAAKTHALEQFPKESCGLVVSGQYVPCHNYAEKLNDAFEIASAAYKRAGDGLQAVLHSHTNGGYAQDGTPLDPNLFPSQDDMEAQIASDVPWGILVTDGQRVSDPLLWGDSLPIAPMIGREFYHGVQDCFSVVRDAFRLGRDRMADQGLEWPFAPIDFADVPRDDGWWEQDRSLYEDALEPRGFKIITMNEARPGDGFLMKIKSKTYNHAGLLVGNNLILHHLATRLSRREPAGLWGRAADVWVRYEGPGHDA